MLASKLITQTDYMLIEIAKSVLRLRRLDLQKHNTACAILTTDGQVITGTNLKGVSMRELGVCAEPIALSELEEMEKQPQTIVTVYIPHTNDTNHDIRVISPCGSCRELLCDYSPNALILCIDEDHILKKVHARELLPARFTR